MKNLCRYDQPECSACGPFQRVRNRVPGNAIARAHPANVGGKYAVRHQLGDRTFKQARRRKRSLEPLWQ